MLIISGPLYLAIGVRHPWVGTFFSATFLGNLGTTLLIMYVMTVPVSDGIQGAYLVAVTITGVILGVGASIFKEVTEGLGCILGGFSLSMWILTLIPGGLIPQEAPKAAFIAVMSIGPFGLFFINRARDYALIGLISFGGATATVIGIDCFSRVGLKEFWAFIWNLNEDLFPTGATTYPITKGMRVEAGAIIFLFLIGIVSQLKLWRVIQGRRAQKAADEAEDARNLQEEEEAVGREVEERTARDRRAWERAHGSIGSDADMEESTTPNSQDSGDLVEKRMRVMSAVSTRPHSFTESTVNVMGTPSPGVLKAEAPGSEPALMTPGTGDGTSIMVRVVPDKFPRAPDRGASLDPEEQAWAHNQNHGVRDSSPPPQVVPLPFQFNENEEGDGEADCRTVGARSSIAGTYADDDEQPQSKRSSLAKRLSYGSTNLLRSVSQRTDRSMAGAGKESQERLVGTRVVAGKDEDRGSLAATADMQSLDDGRSTVRDAGRKSMEITADLVGDKEEDHAQEVGQTMGSDQPDDNQASSVPKPAESVAPSEVQSGKGSKTRSVGVAGPLDAESSGSKRDNSSSSPTSSRVPLTRDSLPRPLSRMALKYRTNEWVKHSTTADAPEPGEISIADEPESEEEVSEIGEQPAPVNVDQLQQTATTGTPAPATTPEPFRFSTAISSPNVRSVSHGDFRASMIGNEHTSRALGRSSSGFFQVGAIPEEPNRVPSVAPVDDDRSSSRNSASASPYLQNRASSSSPANGIPYSSTNTLLGQRDTYIRNKPLGTHTPLNTGTPVDYSLGFHHTPSESPIGYGTPGRSRSRSPDEDDDDMPLSQRRKLIRQSSALSFQLAPSVDAEIGFNSHQPQRKSTAPLPAVREVQLANFRQSVQTDLRAGTPVLASTGRESSLIGRGLDVQRGIELQRSAMMRNKEAEAQAREAERWEREKRQSAFEARLRSGELMDAHREAMKRLQGQAKG